MTRPFDKHLDSGELDRLSALAVPDEALSGARRHAETCAECGRKLEVAMALPSEIWRMRAPQPSPPTPECMGDAGWLEVAAGLLPPAQARERMRHAAQCGHCGPLLKNAAEALVEETAPGEEEWLAALPSAQPEWRKNMAQRLQDNCEVRDDREGAVELNDEIRAKEPGRQPGTRASKKESALPWWQGIFAWPRPAFGFAGILVAVASGWLGWWALHPVTAQQLLARAYTEHRTLEVRIPGAAYAPERVERGAAGSSLDKPPALLKAEALIAENLRKHPNDPAWLQAKARADLLDGNADAAIKSLQRALEDRPDDPALLTDLGTAYYVRAEAADRPIDYGNAIEALGKALAKSPDDPVALFNRALACERMFLFTQAVDDWQHYLRIDPQGEWAEDARKRLAAIQEKLQEHEKSQNEPLMTPEEIARAGDDPAVRDRIDERIEDYLHAAVIEWLPIAYPASGDQSPAQSSDARASIAILADVARQKHGDRWLADLMTSSSNPNFPLAVAQLASAVKADDSGNPEAALHSGREAEDFFGAAGSDAGVMRAKLEHIFASQYGQDGAECARSAHSLSSQIDGHPYGWIKSQFLIERGNCNWLLGDLGGARSAFVNAAKASSSSDYGATYLRSQDHLSGLLATIGDFPSAWATSHSALAHFWAGRYPEMRGYNLYFESHELARAQRKPQLQFAAWRDGLKLSESFGDKAMCAIAHSMMADSAIAIGKPSMAERELARASELFAASPPIKSTRIAAMEAETRLAEVEIRQGDAQKAASRLQSFEPEISAMSDDYLAIMFYTALGQSQFEIGNDDRAETALRSAIEFAEAQLHSVHDDSSRLTWTQQCSKAYRDMVQLRLRQGDSREALEIWEWYRGAPLRMGGHGRSPSAAETAPALNQVANVLPRLKSETFISYALLSHGMATWVYDDRGVFAHWTDASPEGMEAAIRRFSILCADPASDEPSRKQAARRIYDLLVAPIEQYLAPGRMLTVELDEGLHGLPLEALVDAKGQYMGDRGPMLSSLGVYYRSIARASEPITATSKALVVAVPTSRVREVQALPDAVPEAEMVAHSLSASGFLKSGDASLGTILSRLPEASVFHFAGHAVSSPQGAGLLLSDSLMDAGSLRPNSLGKLQLAVFSACDTQDGSAEGVYDADSMVRTFLRRGVPHVVASRWNVDSAATRQFMSLFYQALLSGNSVAESVHKAQVRVRSNPATASPFYWSAFAAFGEI